MKVGSPEWADLIIGGAKALGIDLDLQQAHQFSIHAAELLTWNKKINLTAIVDPREVAIKHFLDSIAAARLIPPGATLLDIGSGAGFPGIVLKIVLPSLSVTLIDGSRKKITFLKHIIRTLQLKNIDARQIRAEEMVKDPGLTAAFDVIVSRALSSLQSYIAMALPLLAQAGTIIALKGKIDQSEIDDWRSNFRDGLPGLPSDRSRLSLRAESYELPHIQSRRTIYLVRKSCHDDSRT